MQALLARILKESVQFWYDTSSVRGGGGGSRKRSSGNLWSLCYFISVSVPSSFENFQTHLALWVLNLCRYASLLNNDIFIQPGTPSNWSKCQMYNNNENWSYFVSDILIYLGKSLQIISLFPQNLGVQRRPFFVLWASQDALLAKAWGDVATTILPPSCQKS
jgi:hypothetical protein